MKILDAKHYEILNLEKKRLLHYVSQKLGSPQNIYLCISEDTLKSILEDRLRKMADPEYELNTVEIAVLMIAIAPNDDKTMEIVSTIPALKILLLALLESFKGNHESLLELPVHSYLKEVHPLTLQYWARVLLDSGKAELALKLVFVSLEKSPIYTDLYTLYIECKKAVTDEACASPIYSEILEVLG